MKNNVSFDTFLEYYNFELIQAHKQDPERYHWPVEQLTYLMQMARLQLKSGTYPKTCPVLLATYRKMKMKGIQYDN